MFAYQNSNTRLVANPTEQELNELIKEAQINILPSFNVTGIKIKLMNALYNGRHCITNDAAIEWYRPAGNLHYCRPTLIHLKKILKRFLIAPSQMKI